VLLATGRYLGEGFDDPRLDTLFLTMPIAWKGTLAQYAGRLHRLHDAKREVLIYDYVDQDVPVLARMAAKRRRAYHSIGYGISAEDSVLSAEPMTGAQPRETAQSAKSV
jgi:superfamily II DNA or RNA helicase